MWMHHARQIQARVSSTFYTRYDSLFTSYFCIYRDIVIVFHNEVELAKAYFISALNGKCD